MIGNRVAARVLIHSLFVLRKIPVVRNMYVIAIPLFQNSVFGFVDQFFVAFFKYLRVWAHTAADCAVFGNLIDEEQRQHFNSLGIEPQLFVQMDFYGLANLLPLNQIIIYVANGRAERQGFRVGKLHALIARCAVDARNGVPLIKLTLTRKNKQIRVGLDRQSFA